MLSRFGLIVLLGMSLVLNGCAVSRWLGLSKPEPEFVVPTFDTAMEQYAFAERNRRQMVRSMDKDRRAEQDARVKVLYQTVADRFPDDKEYTPQAKFVAAALLSGSQDQEDKFEAYNRLQEIIRDYGDNDRVLARALLQRGRVCDSLQRYEEALDSYREVFDRYKDSLVPELKEIAAQARKLFNQVRTRNPTPQKPRDEQAVLGL